MGHWSAGLFDGKCPLLILLQPAQNQSDPAVEACEAFEGGMLNIFEFAEFARPLACAKLTGCMRRHTVRLYIDREFLHTRLELGGFAWFIAQPFVNCLQVRQVQFARNFLGPVEAVESDWLPPPPTIVSSLGKAIVVRCRRTGDLITSGLQIGKDSLDLRGGHLKIAALSSPFQPGFRRFLEGRTSRSRIGPRDGV